MGRKSVHTPRLTRREKATQDRIAAAAIKSLPSTSVAMPRIDAKNANQKSAIGILNRGTPVVFLTGSAGTGKSLLAAYRAATLLKSKQISKLYLVRPAVATGKTIGLLPGEVKDKLGPYFAQTLRHLASFLGQGDVNGKLESGVIEMAPVEYMRGVSFEDCFVLVEESQNFTAEEFEMMLTRLGENCTMVFTGDTKQHDLKGVSGLETTLKLLRRVIDEVPDYLSDDDLDDLEDGYGVVKFTPEDVVRSGLTKSFVKIFYHNS